MHFEIRMVESIEFKIYYIALSVVAMRLPFTSQNVRCHLVMTTQNTCFYSISHIKHHVCSPKCSNIQNLKIFNSSPQHIIQYIYKNSILG